MVSSYFINDFTFKHDIFFSFMKKCFFKEQLSFWMNRPGSSIHEKRAHF